MKKQSFFQKRSVIATFGILALLGGFFLVNKGYISGRVTGNVIQSEVYLFGLVPIIGMLLISCSAILIIYALVKKK